jgi:hypothetical protein
VVQIATLERNAREIVESLRVLRDESQGFPKLLLSPVNVALTKKENAKAVPDVVEVRRECDRGSKVLDRGVGPGLLGIENADAAANNINIGTSRNR